MLVLLFGVHIFLTVRLGFIQRYIFRGIRLSFRSEETGKGDISHFASLSTALAATIGTGNIVGVATAVSLGGPGAVLWCWMTGVFGIATKYSEAVLAVKYRVQTDRGTMAGGPMYALEKGMKSKTLAVLFSIFTACAAFGIGNMVQANAISNLAMETFSIPSWITGIVLTLLVAAVLIGGIRSIAGFCSLFVPLMAILYIGGCIAVLIVNSSYLIPAIEAIVSSAFNIEAVGGGAAGAGVIAAARYGIARGLFSNESGLGSAPIVAAAAQTSNPVRQGLVSSTATFWDTVVVCALTGLVVVTAIIRDPVSMNGLGGAVLTKASFESIPIAGPLLLNVGLLTFVFSTILGWSYYGERAVEYLTGQRGILPYRFLWVGAVFAGSVMSLPLVWDLADVMNALMAFPNLIALIFLSGVVASETGKHIRSCK